MGERLERYVPKALSAHRVQCCHDTARAGLEAVDDNIANFYLLPLSSAQGFAPSITILGRNLDIGRAASPRSLT